MVENVQNVVLEYLRRLDQTCDWVIDEVREIEVGMTKVDEGLVHLNRRMDRFETRLEPMERRLDLHDPAQLK